MKAGGSIGREVAAARLGESRVIERASTGL